MVLLSCWWIWEGFHPGQGLGPHLLVQSSKTPWEGLWSPAGPVGAGKQVDHGWGGGGGGGRRGNKSWKKTKKVRKEARGHRCSTLIVHPPIWLQLKHLDSFVSHLLLGCKLVFQNCSGWFWSILDQILVLCWLLDSLTPDDLRSGLRRKFAHKLANCNRAGIHAQHTQQQQLSALISSSVPRKGAVNLRNPLQQRTAGKRKSHTWLSLLLLRTHQVYCSSCGYNIQKF